MALFYSQMGFVMPVHHGDAGQAPMAGRPKNPDHALRAGGPADVVFQNATDDWHHLKYLIP